MGDVRSDNFPEKDHQESEHPSFIPTTNLMKIVASGNKTGTEGKQSSGENAIADLGLKSGSGTDPGSGNVPFHGYAV